MIDFARELFEHPEVTDMAWVRRWKQINFWVRFGTTIPENLLLRLDLAQEYWDSL